MCAELSCGHIISFLSLALSFCPLSSPVKSIWGYFLSTAQYNRDNSWALNTLGSHLCCTDFQYILAFEDWLTNGLVLLGNEPQLHMISRYIYMAIFVFISVVHIYLFLGLILMLWQREMHITHKLADKLLWTKQGLNWVPSDWGNTASCPACSFHATEIV